MEYFQNCLFWLIIIFLWTCLPVQNPILSCLPCVTMILVSVNSKLPDAHHSFSKTNLYSAGRWTPLLSQATQAQCVSLIINTCSFMLRNLKWPWIYRTTPKGASTFSPRHPTIENLSSTIFDSNLGSPRVDLTRGFESQIVDDKWRCGTQVRLSL